MSQLIVQGGQRSTGHWPPDNRHVLKGHRMHCPQVHQQPRGHRHTPQPSGVRGRAQLWPGRPSSSSLHHQTLPLWTTELVHFSAGFPGVVRFYWDVLTFKASVWKDIWACKRGTTGKSLAQGPPGSLIKTQMLLLLWKVWQKIHSAYLGKGFYKKQAWKFNPGNLFSWSRTELHPPNHKRGVYSPRGRGISKPDTGLEVLEMQEHGEVGQVCLGLSWLIILWLDTAEPQNVRIFLPSFEIQK